MADHQKPKDISPFSPEYTRQILHRFVVKAMGLERFLGVDLAVPGREGVLWQGRLVRWSVVADALYRARKAQKNQ